MQDKNATEALFSEVSARLERIAKLPAHNAERSLESELESKGVSRRDFMKWAGAMTAALSLPASFATLTARAAEVANRTPVIWLHMAECTGCSESLLRTEDPSVDSILFDMINLEYHETIMAASGYQASQNLENAIKKHHGNYILMVEGGIPKGNEYFLTIGADGTTGAQECRHAAEGAMAIFAIGTCSSYGASSCTKPN